MTTRRSRLQIKPNILGGPKTTSTKPSGKSLDISKAINNEKESTGIKSPKVKSPTRVMSPRRGVAINKPKDTKLDEKKADDVKTDNKTKESDLSVEHSVAVTTDQNSSDKDSTKSETPVLPTRARLRNFGRVNIGAARGVKTEQTAAQNTLKTETINENNKNTKSVSATTVVTKNDSSIDEKEQNSKSEDSLRSSNVTSIPRRSRFPKAKPNIADIGRRKQRVNAINDTEKSSQPSVQTEELSEVPEITVTDTCEKTINVPSKVHVESEEPDLDLHHSDHLTLPTQTNTVSTSSVVPKSPLKHPVPTIPTTPEKRARALSTSEPVVVKRQRKPKIDAPTDQPPDRSTMKMRDLIRWNPSNNPMQVSATKINNKPDTSREKENVIVKESENTPSTNTEKAVEVEDDALPVPQVTIGPDGNIVINEKSLVVKDPELEKAPSQDDDVIDETDTFTTYGSFRKSKRSKRWSEKETKKFYKALAMIGIDFFLICQLFPGRTRYDIKKKFQKEEKINRHLVEKVLRERINFDPKMFDENNEDSSEEEDKKSKKAKTKKPNDSNKPKNQQKTTKSRLSRRRHNPNYYDDSDTTDDDLEHKRHRVSKIKPGSDSRFQPPSVSQKDGEVVGILMDMSEGRLNNEGQNDDNEETFIATPVDMSNLNSNVNNSNTHLNVEDNGSHNPRLSNFSNLRTRAMEVSSMDGLSQHTNEGIPIGNLGALQGINTNISSISQQNVSSGMNNSLILPVVNNSINIGVTNNDNQQTQYRQNPVVSNPLSGFNVTSLHPQSLLRNPDDNDQYVLVTVVPEGGGETVIHVYRLHGGVALETAESSQPEILSNSNQSQILPESNPPQILPNSNQSQFLPESNPPQILPNSNQTQVLPESKAPQIIPNSNQSHVLPESNPPQILPNSNQTQVLPESNPPQILPNSNQSQVLPESKPSQILPNSNQSQVLLEPKPPQILPNSNQSQVLPECNTPPILPISEACHILQESEQSSALMETDQIQILPQTDQTSVLPQTDQTSVLPQTDQTSVLPQTDQTSVLPQTEGIQLLPETERT